MVGCGGAEGDCQRENRDVVKYLDEVSEEAERCAAGVTDCAGCANDENADGGEQADSNENSEAPRKRKRRRRSRRHVWVCGAEYSNLPIISQARNQQARKIVKAKGRRVMHAALSAGKVAGLLEDGVEFLAAVDECPELKNDYKSSECSDDCGDECGSVRSPVDEHALTDGEHVESVDEDFLDENWDEDEGEVSGGRAAVPVKVGSMKMRAQLDTAAQSIWVSHDWYVKHFGAP